MNDQALEARIRRLGKLIDGFAAEIVQLGIDSSPLDPEERTQYLDAIGEAQTALGKARNALTQAKKRLGREKGYRRQEARIRARSGLPPPGGPP